MKPWEKFQNQNATVEPAKPWEKFQKDKPADAGLVDSEQGDFSRGLDNYIPQTKQTLGYAGALAGETLRRAGAEDWGSSLRDYGLDVAKDQEAILQQQSKPADSFSGISSLGDAADWLQYNAGQAVGNLGETLATAAAGAVAGSAIPGAGTLAGAAAGAVGKTGVKTALKTAGKELAESMTKDVVLERAKKGATAAMVGSAVTHGLGETTGYAVQDNKDLSQLTPEQMAKLYAGGVAAGGLEFLGDKVGLDAVLHGTGGAGGIVRQTLKSVGSVGAKEAGTEVAQTAVQRAGAERSLTNAEALKDYLDSGTSGFVQGGAVGGAGSAAHALLNPVTENKIQKNSSTTTNNLGNLIASGEGDYGSFNRGNAGDSAGEKIDFSQVTVGEVMRRQALPKGHPERIFTVGKYQAIPSTLAEAVNTLGIDPNERLTPDLQERIFSDYLLRDKRPAIRDYIEGKHDNLTSAQVAGAQEWASIADPHTGKSYYGGVGNNAASITAEQFGGALQQARTAYQNAINAGVDKTTAWRNAVGAIASGQVEAGVGQVDNRQPIITGDAELDAALADVQPEPVADFSLDPAALEAELQSQLTTPEDVGSQNLDIGSQVGAGNALINQPDATQIDDYAALERAAIQNEEPLTDLNLNPNPEPDLPFNDGPQHPAEFDPSAYDQPVPFSRDLGLNGTETQAFEQAWQVMPDQRDADILSRAVSGLPAGIKARFEAVQMPQEMQPAAETISRVFGKKVVFVRGDAQSRQLFQGAIVPSAARNRIFVNVDSRAGYMNVIGHELYEHLHIDRPDLHQWFASAAQLHIKNFPAYRQRLAAVAQRADAEGVDGHANKELLADFVGDALADPAFLRSLAQENPNKFQQFAANVMRWLNSLLAQLQGKRDAGSLAFFTKVDKLRGTLRGVLSEYADGLNNVTSNQKANIAANDVAKPEVHFMAMPSTPKQAEQSYQDIAKTLATAWQGMAARAEDLYQGGFKAALHLMTFNNLIDRYGALFGKVDGDPLRSLEGYKRLMRAVTQNWANRFQKAHDLFTALSAEQQQGISMLMYDATMHNLHPDQAEYTASISVQWAAKRIKQFNDDLAAIAADQRKNPKNRIYDEKQALAETNKAKRGIDILNNRIAFEQRRSDAFPRLREQWEQLTPAQQHVYQSWKRELEALWEKQTDALEKKLSEMRGMNPADAKVAKGLVTELRAEYRKRLKQGAYFPLRRYGKHIVLVRQGELYERAHFETYSESQEFLRTIKAERPNASVLYLKDYKEGLEKAAKDVPGIAGQLLGVLNKQGAEFDPVVREAINKFIVESLPEVSARKPELRRHYIAGASQDMERGFAHTMLHGGHDLSRIMFGHKVQDALQAMTDVIRAHEDLHRGIYKNEPLKLKAAADLATAISADKLPLAADVLNVVRKQVDGMMNPDTSPIAAFMGNAAFFWYLAGSPTAGLLNLMQTAQVTYPVLASKFGGVKAAQALGVALADVVKAARKPQDVREGLFATSDAAFLPEDERVMLKALELDGTTQTTQANAMARVANGDGRATVGNFALSMDKPMAYLGWFFHNAEILNRQAAQLAAFRLYKGADAPMQAQLDADHGMQGVGYARFVTERTHFDYSHANRSLALKGNFAKSVLPLKNYSVMMMEFLLTRFKDSIKHESAQTQTLARKELAYVLGMTALFAGMSGLPAMWLLYGVANLFGDETFDAETAWQRWLNEQFGNGGRELVMRGALNAATGLDFSSRIGMGNLLFNDAGAFNEGGDTVKDYLIQALGVNAATAINVGEGMELMARGDVFKGIEKFLPTFARNPVKAARMATEGVTDRKHSEIVAPGDLNAAEIAAQAVGFAPAKVADAYDQRNMIQTTKELRESARERIMNKARGYYLDGRGDIKAIEREIAAFNRSQPHLKITRQDVAKSVKAARTNRKKQGNTGTVSMSDKMRKQLKADGYLQ